MVKVLIVVQPTGLINGFPWPKAGEEFELPEATAADMAAVGHVKITEEKRPASRKGVENRKG